VSQVPSTPISPEDRADESASSGTICRVDRTELEPHKSKNMILLRAKEAGRSRCRKRSRGKEQANKT